MFQQLPINENRQQQSYALIAQNKAIDSKFQTLFIIISKKIYFMRYHNNMIDLSEWQNHYL